MIVQLKRIGMIRIAYLLPIVNAVILLLLACIPRFFYLADGTARNTLSLFELMGNTYTSGTTFLGGTVQGTTADLYFYFVMLSIFWVSVIGMVLYGLFCIATACMTCFAWTPLRTPTTLENKLKRTYRLLVPNRGFFVFFQVLPLIPAIFPYFFQLFANRMLGQNMRVYYLGIPDFVIVILLAAVSLTLFFVTLHEQKEYKMDLFRIFKIEND